MTLLRVLDEGRVHMHVVLRGEIVVEYSIDILQLDETGVLVGGAQFGVWSMEVAATTTSNGGEHCLVSEQHLPGSEGLRQHTLSCHIYLL